ncbi:hypothetical protein [Amycolatopsis sp. 195334CR]|uniref:hypothetical protein n=1 Tax=Amycolatopsis sp. 195334CR TaxID=2814588 RepID=UPI001A8D71C0|nr:hypothetical protein [Amycolatopsis sp. 195334CR]MBN6039125.1 hypothetical protein [Amycolatopsis sp. 195334CR]
MLKTSDLNDDEAWEAKFVLDMCREGCAYSTATGYAWVDVGHADAEPNCKEITDRLMDANLMVTGRSEAVRLDDGTYTTAQLDLTDAGKKFRNQLHTEFGG